MNILPKVIYFFSTALFFKDIPFVVQETFNNQMFYATELICKWWFRSPQFPKILSCITV